MTDAEPICDFCLKPEVQWTHCCTPFTVTNRAGRTYVDDGEWAVCNACHEQLVKQDYVELGRLAYIGNTQRLGHLSDSDVAHLVAVLDTFVENYNGMYYADPVH